MENDSMFPPFRRWYRFGWESPAILFKRLHGKHRPIFRARMMWQRAVRGVSDEDCWSLDHHLARVTVIGVRKLREWAHGYPAELASCDEWDAILFQIEEGFQTWLDNDGWFVLDSDREKFDKAVLLYGKWFSALWD